MNSLKSTQTVFGEAIEALGWIDGWSPIAPSNESISHWDSVLLVSPPGVASSANSSMSQPHYWIMNCVKYTFTNLNSPTTLENLALSSCLRDSLPSGVFSTREALLP